MRLVRFGVRNYRSITDTDPIDLGDWTVLLGPNNEGKSNLVRALVTALEYARSLRQAVLRRGRVVSQTRRLDGTARDYVWEDDFPISLQASKPDGETVFHLWFRLTAPEKSAFRKRIGSNLSTDLPLEIRVGQSGQAKVLVRMRGRGAPALNANTEAIAQFIGERLDFEHIPAIRPGERAREIVHKLVEQELYSLQRDPAYRAALARIEELEATVLDRVSADVLATLHEFMGDVRNVKIDRLEDRHVASRRSYQLVVDDGNPTPLSFKGDGVQSIAALSLMRAVSSRRAAGRDLILAIEEPEAHLHPGAMHKLRAILQEISATTQVVMTTHHPVFVDRRNPSNNVIVQNSRARPARTLDEIRKSLGVQASDNLRHAENVLLVEGECDRMALTALFKSESPPLSAALDGGKLIIVGLGGADKLAYHAAITKGALCGVYAFLDSDQAGKQAARTVRDAGTLETTDVFLASARGAAEAEMEDMYVVDLYKDRLQRDFGVVVPSRAYSRSRSKWSGRIEAAFCEQGKDWDAEMANVKTAVAQEVATRPAEALHAPMRAPFDALVRELESRCC